MVGCDQVLPLMNTMERLLESPEEWEVPLYLYIYIYIYLYLSIYLGAAARAPADQEPPRQAHREVQDLRRDEGRINTKFLN